MSHHLKTYTSLGQLGLTVGSETMAAIALALHDGESLQIKVDAINNAVVDGTAYPVDSTGGPLNFGTLIVYRANPNRVNFTFFLNNKNTQEFIGFYNAAIFKWSGWVPIATAEPPTEYDLPLSSGFTAISGNKPVYGKDGSGHVTLSGMVKVESTDIRGKQIGTLPVGFRPSKTIPFTLLQGVGTGGVSWITYGTIGTNGAITVWNGALASNCSINNAIVIQAPSFIPA